MDRDTQGFRKFRAPTFEEALRQMRAVLGESAVVVRTTQVKEGGLFGLFGEPLIELTVAPGPSLKGTPSGTHTNLQSRPPSPVERRYRVHSPVGSDQRVRDTVEFCRELLSKAQTEIDARHARRTEMAGGIELPNATAAPGLDGYARGGTEKPHHQAHRRPRRNKGTPLASEGNAAIAPASFTRLNEPSQKPTTQDQHDDIRELLRILDRDASSSGVPTELAPHYRRLVETGVSPTLAASLLGATVRGCNVGVLSDQRVVRERLRLEIRRRIQVTDGISVNGGGRAVVAVIGPTGVGKTTNLAKLAARFAIKGRRRVAFVTADTYRVAAPDQLRVYADIIGLRMKTVNEPNEMRSALEVLHDYDLVLIDTAGSSQFNREQLDELQQMMLAADPSSVMLAAAANTPLDDLRQVVENFGRVKPTSLLFTKLDETRRYGAMYAMALEAALPLSYLSIGQNVPDDIVVAEPAMVANLVLEGRDRSGRSSRTSS